MLIMILLSMAASTQDTILVVYGPKTSETLVGEFNNMPTYFLQDTMNFFEIKPNMTISIIFDITFDSKILWKLDMISEYYQAPYLTISKPFESESTHSRFYALQTLEMESIAIKELIKSLKWSELTIIGLNTLENIQKRNIVKSS